MQRQSDMETVTAAADLVEETERKMQRQDEKKTEIFAAHSAAETERSMEIRHAKEEDLLRMIEIYAHARRFMAETGNPNQWGPTNWPPEELLREDIRQGRSYVCTTKPQGNIVGTFCYLYGERIDQTYDVIEDGTWSAEEAYGVVHRLAAEGARGVGSFCLGWAFSQCGYLRVDTHPDNRVMQNLLTKLGFQKRGIIHVVEDHYPRYAYDKIQKKTVHVFADGSGDYPNIGAALREYANTEFPLEIRLGKGRYEEQLCIERPNLTLTGEAPDAVFLTGSLYARMPMEDIGKLGTFRSYSSYICTHDFTAKNLTFENTAGMGKDVGQALALYADGDRLFFENCRFTGHQDTLFTAPLPPMEIEKNGFVGPGQHRPRNMGRHFYKNCYFEGDIDFIFGGAAAYFENCEFFSKDQGLPVNSYVTAASTPKDEPYGYVMDHCRFTGDCPEHSAYLGRPWREYAKTVLLHCEIGAHICPEGWDDWGKTDAHETIFFAEYESYGPSADLQKRPSWVRRLTKPEASLYRKELVLGGRDGWDPEKKGGKN